MDSKIKKVNKTSAVKKGLESIREYIQDTDDSLLPSEDYLAKSLGISRLTVREAITVLEREGVVSKIQGKGTLINAFVKKLENRIDLGSDIEGRLRKNGLNVEFEVESIKLRQATSKEITKLSLNENDYILEIRKILRGNKQAEAIYVDRIPEKYFKNKNYLSENYKSVIFPTIERLCECNITHDVVTIYSCNADNHMSKIFDIPENTAVQCFDILEYTSDGTAIMFNTEYYSGKIIEFTLCRNVAYKSWL